MSGTNAGDHPFHGSADLMPAGLQGLSKKVDPHLRLHDGLSRFAQLTPDATAVIFEGNRLSYEETNRLAENLAFQLQTLGVRPNQIVAVMARRSLWLPVGLYGVLKAGGAYLPIDPGQPAERVRFLLEDSGAGIALVDEGVSVPDSMNVQTHVISDLAGETPIGTVKDPSKPTDLAYVIYTSGSTGKPKGAMIEHRSIMNCLTWMADNYGFYDRDVLLQKTPITFDVSVHELFGWSLAGANMVLAKPGAERNPETLIQTIEQEKVTRIHFVPSVLDSFLDYLRAFERADAARSIRDVFCIGEALQPATVSLFRSLLGNPFGSRIHNLYGPAEAAVHVTCFDCGTCNDKVSIPIGKPVWNTSIYLLDECRKPVPEGKAGELYIGGIHVGRGYHNRPDLTRDAFLPDPFAQKTDARMYKTGDLAKMLPDGNLVYLGRNDFQVKVNGVRIELGEIEAALREVEEISGAAVIAQKRSNGDNRLIGFYTLQSPAPDDKRISEKLVEYLSSRLPAQMIPGQWVRLDAFPLNASGKLDRKTLMTKIPAEDAPSGKTEQAKHALETIFEELLGRRDLSDASDFLELGGHSLTAVRLISRIRMALGAKLGIDDIFELRTIGRIKERIAEKNDGTPAWETVARVSRDRPHPLSQVQEHILIECLKAPDLPVYNEVATVYFHQKIDAGKMEGALNRLIERHEPLRTSYQWESGELLQTIEEPVNLRLPLVDFSRYAEPDRMVEAERYADAWSKQLFDLGSAPLIRAFLGIFAEDDHRLYLVTHHLAADAYTYFDILVKDLWTLYQSESSLPEPDIQYIDYVNWLSERKAGKATEKEAGFWKEKLRDFQPFEYPCDKPRPKVLSYRGRRKVIRFGRELSEQVKDLSRDLGSSQFVILLSAFYTLLHRLTGKEDIVLGSVGAGRDHPQTEHLAGCFIRYLALRVRVDPARAFKDMVKQVEAVLWEALDNQDASLMDLIEELDLHRDSSRHPVYQVMFLAEPPVNDLPDGLTVSQLDFHTHTSKLDLSVEMDEEDGEIIGRIEFNTDLFEQTSIDQLFDCYRTTLESLVRGSPANLLQVSCISDAKLKKVTETFNASEHPIDPSLRLHDGLSRFARETPDALAVSDQHRTLTYAELDEQSNRIAVHLQSLGAGPEAIVAVVAHRSIDLPVALFGVLKAGAAYLPVDPGLPEKRIEFFLRDSAATLALADDPGKLPSGFPGQGFAIGEIAGKPVDSVPEDRAKPHNLAYVIYTSGSTGKPKGTMIEHRSIVNLTLWMQQVYGFTAGDVLLQKTPITFDASLQELFTWSFCGASLHVPRSGIEKDPEALLENIRNRKVTYIDFVPSMLEPFLNYLHEPEDLQKLRSVRMVFCGGEVLSTATVRLFQEKIGQPLGIKLHNLYGPTETTVDVCAFDCTELRSHTVLPIGKPVWNTRLYVLDSHLRPMPVGVPGELFIGGVQVSRGYLGRPELNQQAFLKDPFDPRGEGRLYKTGDQARWLPDGNLEYLGRNDFQIKVRGVRIEPGEIEAAIREFPRITGCTVVARKNASADTRLAAYFTHKGNRYSPEDYEALKSFLGTKLASQMIPTCFQELDSFPLNASGKLDRNALPDLDMEKPAVRQVDFSDIEDPLEGILASIWLETLDIRQLDRTAGFFESGGNSLNAIRMLGRVRKSLGITISISDFLGQSSFKNLLSLVRQGRSSRGVEVLIRPRDAKCSVPASRGQRNLWFIHQIDESGIGYNVASGIKLRGQLNPPELESALLEIISKHEALRTVFREIDGEPVQVIREAGEDASRYVSLEYETKEAYDPRCREILEEEWRRRFDLEKGPLFFARIISFGDRKHLLTLSMHHIICDERADEILYAGLTAYFAGSGVPTPKLQMGDFAVWEKSEEAGALVQSQKAWWKARMGDAPPSLDLPADYRRKDQPAFVGDCVEMRLPEAVSEKFRSLVRRADSTLFMGFQAAWAYFLGKISRSEDVVIGAPVSLRRHPDLEDTMGFLLNTLPFRVRFREDQSFTSLLTECRESTLEVHRNLDMPFAELVQLLDAGGSRMGSPLFQVLLVMSGRTRTPPDIPGVESTILNTHPPSAKFELTLFVADHDEGIHLRLEYRSDLFKESTIRGWLQDFSTLIESLTTNEDPRLADLLLTHKASVAIQRSWSAPGPVQPNGAAAVADHFAQCATKFPDHPAIVHNGRTIPYKCLADRVEAWSGVIRKSLTAGTERRVGICMKRSEGFLVAAFATLRSGAAYVPLDPAWPDSRLAWFIMDAEVDAIICPPDEPLSRIEAILFNRNGRKRVRLIPMDPENPAEVHGEKTQEHLPIEPEAPAYLIYTSGSTGQPKGVIVRHRSVVASTLSRKTVYPDQPGRFLLLSPPIFDSSVAGIYWSLLGGGTLVLPPAQAERDPQIILDLIRKQAITHILCLPSVYENLLGFIEEDPLQSLTTVIVAGETCPDYLPELHRRKLPKTRLFNEYGPTEGTVWCTALEITNHRRGMTVPIGKPVPHSRVWVVDDQNRTLPRGARGELVIAGEGLAAGYFKQPGLTRNAFIEPVPEFLPEKRIYRTGDMGRWLEDGCIEFCGRKDDQLKVRGYRIEPGEIENVLNQHPAVKTSVVTVVDYGNGDNRLTAYFTSTSPVGEKILKTFLGGHLPDYMVPFRLVHLDSMPLTSNGKVDKSRLPRPRVTSNAIDHPATADEKKLASLYQEILNIPQVGLQDSFFDLGGDSLQTIRLAKRVKETFGNPLAVADIFRFPTIARLSKRMGASEKDRSYSMRLAGDGGGLQLFFLPGIPRNPLVFKRLAERLSPEATSYGIELPPPEAGIEPLESMEAIGSHCLKEIKKIKPEGPYFLCGYSFGGLVTYETARQLHEMDGALNTLVLFDTFLPRPDGVLPESIDRWNWFKKMISGGKWDFVSFSIRNALLVNLFWRWGLLDGPNRPWNRNLGRTHQGTPPLDADTCKYTEAPKPFPFKLHLFTVRQTHYTRKGLEQILRWNRYTSQTIIHSRLKTDYHLRMLDDKYLDFIRDSILSQHNQR